MTMASAAGGGTRVGRCLGCRSGRQRREIGSGNQRIRDLPIAFANRIGEVSEDRHRRQLELAASRSRCCLERLGEHAVGAIHRYATRRVDSRDSNAEIFEAERRPETSVISLTSGDEDGVHLTGNGKVALQARQRRKHGANVRLLRLDRELSKSIARQDAGEDQPDRASDFVLAAEERFDGHLGRLLQPGQKHVAFLGADLRSQRWRHHHPADRLLPVKGPESIVDAVDDHVRRAAARKTRASRTRQQQSAVSRRLRQVLSGRPTQGPGERTPSMTTPDRCCRDARAQCREDCRAPSRRPRARRPARQPRRQRQG